MSDRRRVYAHPLPVDIALVALVCLEAATTLQWDDPWQPAFALLAASGVVLRRRFPWAGLVLTLPSIAFSAISLPALITLYRLARVQSKMRSTALGAALVFVAVERPWSGYVDFTPGLVLVSLLFSAVIAAAPAALGTLVQTRAELSLRVADLSELREAERRLLLAEVLTQERTRIAREMHDVVSHDVSLIAVQSGALQASSADADVVRIATTIRALAARTLDELREMVTVLRATDTTRPTAGESPLAPQPSVRDITAMVQASHPEADLQIALERPLTPAQERALYRGVQEALTNARKHAPGVGTSVRIALIGGWVELRVRTARRLGGTAEFPPSGYGLIGLRERAQLLGGDLEVLDDPDGFTLVMSFPATT